MRLNNDLNSFRLLYEAVYKYYKNHGNRNVSIFADKAPQNGEKYYVRFLLDREHVIEYAILQDRGVNLSGLSLAIGPHYFGPADFWSYENAERFTSEATTAAIEHNLALLDEYFASLKNH